MNKKHILESVGYRIPASYKDAMCKPVGTHVFKYDLNTNTIYNHFYGRGSVKDLLCWESTKIEAENAEEFLDKLMHFEAYTNISSGRYVNFGFLTEEQRIEKMLEGTGIL